MIKFSGKGTLSESDVENAMKEVRIALIEADVALDVVKDLFQILQKKLKGKKLLSL